MLPIITVGLTPAGRAVVERIPGDRPVQHHENAEEAAWSLGNDAVTGGEATPGEPVQLDADGVKWLAHIVYGDDAIGPLLAHTDQSTAVVQIPATGLIMIVTDSLGDDQYKPRRVIDGTPESREVTRQAVGAVSRVHAQAFLVVDQLHETPHWPAAIEHQLLRAEETRPAVAPVDPTDAADAARQVSQLNAMVARGQHRPGVFEEQDKARRAGL
jgi:hypothetical protein